MRILIPIFLFVLFLACSESDNSMSTNYNREEQEPQDMTITNDPDNYIIDIDSDTLNYTRVDTLTFSAQNVLFILSVVDYSAGTGEIIVLSENDQELYKENINQNKILTRKLNLPDKPFKVIIQLKEYAGKFNFVLKKNE